MIMVMKPMNSVGLTRIQMIQGLRKNIESISNVYNLLNKYLCQELKRECMYSSGGSPEAMQASADSERITIQDITAAFKSCENAEYTFENFIDRAETLDTMDRLIDSVTSALNPELYLYTRPVVKVRTDCDDCKDKTCTAQGSAEYLTALSVALSVVFARGNISSIEKQQAAIDNVFEGDDNFIAASGITLKDFLASLL